MIEASLVMLIGCRGHLTHHVWGKDGQGEERPGVLSQTLAHPTGTGLVLRRRLAPWFRPARFRDCE